MLIKKVFIIFVFFFFVSTSFASEPCADVKSVADAAIKERNSHVKENYNAIISDPDENRDSLLNCLGSINSIGDMFSMGVTIPNLDSLLDKACNSAEYAIQSKINESMALLEQNATENLGGVNPFSVNIDGDILVDDLIRNIQ